MSVNLNLGCGNKKREGYINIDVAEDVNPDMVCKWEDLDTKFEEGTVDCILTEHFIEHIVPWEVDNFLGMCYKLLKNDGIIIVECPDLLNACKEFVNAHIVDQNETTRKSNLYYLKMSLYPIYANPSNRNMPYDRHMWGYSALTLENMLNAAGFKHVTFEKPNSVAGAPRDMRAVGVKRGDIDE